MISGESILFNIGAILLIAFLGAGVASRLKQSVILGYILVGILIGPNIHIDLGAISYNGLLHDTDFIMYISQLGLVLLMFFVGLEFSFSKLKRTKAPATILAVTNLGMNLFAGIVLGMALGWPLIDTIFLAGVVAMSSCAITAKSLMELKRLAEPETEYLLGMVIVEDFLAMVLLTVVGGLMIKTGAEPVTLIDMALGIVAFYIFFIVLAVWVVPKTVHNLKKIKNDELFVLFALGIVFISAALAEVSGVPAIIGAFFIGMVFAETGISGRLEDRLSPFRDAFVAVFFVSFGMLIDPAMFADVIWMVVIAVILVIINDVLITGAVAYLLGFSSRGALAIGTSLCGRGAESVMYATVGSRAVGTTKGAELFPFAGAFCFVMSAVTPFLMRNSSRIALFLSRILPQYVKHGGVILARTISKIVLPSDFQPYHRPRKLGWLFITLLIVILITLATRDIMHLFGFACALLLAFAIRIQVRREIIPIVLNTNYAKLGVAKGKRSPIVRFVSDFVLISLVAIILTSFLFTYAWELALFTLFCYIVSVIWMMRKYHGISADVVFTGKVHVNNIPMRETLKSSYSNDFWKRF